MDTVSAKTIVTKNRDTSWFGSDYNMNVKEQGFYIKCRI